jgi:pilus assembly protein CpaD
MSSIRAIFIGVTVIGLTACAAAKPLRDDPTYTATTPISQFPLKTVAEPEGILLAPHDFGLSQAQAAALNDLALRWAERRDGVVLIEAPAGGGEDASATAYAARDALESFGVPKKAIEIAGYDGKASPRAPIRVSFLGRQAQIDDCDQSWPDLTKTRRNDVTPNFGCAVSSNIAAMIADPADIDRPRGIDPADAGRRQTVLEKYRAGQVTSSEQDDQAKGTVSQVAN